MADEDRRVTGGGTTGGDDKKGGGTTGGGDKCRENSVKIDKTELKGQNSSLNTTNTIIQYPRPPRRDDGKWIAIGSLLGTLAGLFVNKGLIDKAKDAEDNWRELTDFFKDEGYKNSKWADSLIPCDDKLHDALCKFALCLYKADYQGIFRRARESASILFVEKKLELMRAGSRYHTGINCDAIASLQRAEIAAVVQTTNLAVIEERQRAWDKTFDVLKQTTALFEQHYLGRKGLAFDSLAAAGKNYGYLAESLRQTAKADTKDLATLAGLLAYVLPMLFGWGCRSDSYCDDGCNCGNNDQPNPPPPPPIPPTPPTPKP